MACLRHEVFMERHDHLMLTVHISETRSFQLIRDPMPGEPMF
jgi:hypothetical protein